jgi:hypothetical protein
VQIEKYFKTFYGRMFIKKRLENYFKLLNSCSIGREKGNDFDKNRKQVKK